MGLPGWLAVGDTWGARHGLSHQHQSETQQHRAEGTALKELAGSYNVDPATISRHGRLGKLWR